MSVDIVTWNLWGYRYFPFAFSRARCFSLFSKYCCSGRTKTVQWTAYSWNKITIAVKKEKLYHWVHVLVFRGSRMRFIIREMNKMKQGYYGWWVLRNVYMGRVPSHILDGSIGPVGHDFEFLDFISIFFLINHSFIN